MGSTEKSDIYDVDAGQNLELEYASREPSCQGKLSILSRQESSFFTLTFGMLYLFVLFIFYNYFLFLTVTDIRIPWLPSPPPPKLCPPLPSLPSGHRTPVCAQGLCIYVLWIIPLPYFIQSFPPPTSSF